MAECKHLLAAVILPSLLEINRHIITRGNKVGGEKEHCNAARKRNFFFIIEKGIMAVSPIRYSQLKNMAKAPAAPQKVQ